ncbi:cell division protein ZapE [Snodgrassella sp. W8158]|uniref:cell division protein ZapE n=1 Tax=Snodgrassella TaxID=1193515 RepID=UPI000A06D4E1|nr:MULTISPECIES: cell division protein ZapE [Snodgrassella]MBI0182029.1 cell division protein ZapE [Snodgrassella sp. W8158]ORF05052.1 cell division protein ZapE [Snodgrassella alvi]
MATSVFVAPEFNNQSPLTWYQAAEQQPGFIHDAAQLRAIKQLDRLWTELMMFKRKRNRFLGRSLRSPRAPKGLYMYGGVGRGKSFLMDIFFGCLPYRRKRRVHFHAFMAEVQERLKDHHSQTNPLSAVAQDIAREVRVLCFDEFHVSDIADAMILGRLLEGLFEQGVVMVATSNYAPSELYPQGQNRSSFLPTIALIEKELTILNVDGGEDYRMRTLKPADIFYIPADASSEQKLTELFHKINGEQEITGGEIEILGRKLPYKAISDTTIWFDFNTLCCGPRSQNDYLELAKKFRVLILSDIPKMGSGQMAEARRLTWLIDVLYDYRIKLCASCEVAIDDIYTDGDFANEFTRTASRLTEMRSEEYLTLPHLTLDSENASIGKDIK